MGYVHPVRRFRLPRSTSTVILAAGLAAFGTRYASAAGTPHGCRVGTAGDPAVELGAILQVTSPISATALMAMQAEVERTWTPYRVRIRWLGPGDDATDSRATVDVRVGLDRREDGHLRPTGPHTLGCFQSARGRDSRPLITIFPERAQRLAGALGARVCGRRCLAAWLERLQGRLLGRVLAHELGHYLLGRDHTSVGLMRAEVHPWDVLAGELRAASLTGPQLQRLSALCVDRQLMDVKATP